MAFAVLGAISALGTTVLPKQAAAEEGKMDKLWVYVGTYTDGKSKSQGIYRFELNLATGKATPAELAVKSKDPSFLAIHPNRRFLYAVGEGDNLGDKNVGSLSAFALDPKTGNLTFLNQESSGGSGPCHIIVDKAGKNVLAANYGGGSACSLPIQPDGKLGAATVVQHKGSSIDKGRQEGPHAHSINLDAANRFAFVADLGLDKVMIYRFDPSKSTLTPNDPPAAEVGPGSGPRHFAFHPSGKYAYVINEMALTITAFQYDPVQGVLKTLQTISTVPPGPKSKTWSTAEVVVHPSGKFVYGSNRTQDSIAVFAVDADTGKLTARGHQSHKIKTPRNFAVDPTGAYLLAANQDGNSIVIFRINPETGELTPSGTEVEVPVPVCVRMMPKPG
jgi:6-phosphogluconolactonase